MANFTSHLSLLPAKFSSSFTRFLDTHSPQSPVIYFEKFFCRITRTIDDSRPLRFVQGRKRLAIHEKFFWSDQAGIVRFVIGFRFPEMTDNPEPTLRIRKSGDDASRTLTATHFRRRKLKEFNHRDHRWARIRNSELAVDQCQRVFTLRQRKSDRLIQAM